MEKPQKKVHVGELKNVEGHDFLRDNEYIISGYRINFSSTRRILRRYFSFSLFMVHNESVNVWSHLLGMLLFLSLMLYVIVMLGIPDRLPVSIGNPFGNSTILEEIKDTVENQLSKGKSVFMNLDLHGIGFEYPTLITALGEAIEWQYRKGVEQFTDWSSKAAEYSQNIESQFEGICKEYTPQLKFFKAYMLDNETISLEMTRVYSLRNFITQKFNNLCTLIKDKVQTIQIDSPELDWIDLYNPYDDKIHSYVERFHHVSRCKY